MVYFGLYGVFDLQKVNWNHLHASFSQNDQFHYKVNILTYLYILRNVILESCN